jgi:hypothetical protein
VPCREGHRQTHEERVADDAVQHQADTAAAVLAYFVLRRMKLQSHVPHVSYAPHPEVAVAACLR